MDRMIIQSLNVGTPKTEVFNGKEVITGICKSPVSGPIHLFFTGFESDGVADTKHHGGTDKAVCLYSVDYYSHWEKILSCKLPSAAFGENLSVTHLKEDDICIGDIFRVGTALIQVSQPRQPCATLSARYARPDFAKLVIETGYTGFYCRVIEQGTISHGDELIVQEQDHRKVTVSFANQILHHRRTDCEGIEKVLSVPALSESWTRSFEELKKKCRDSQ
jgi:MOSC domain-containing protein YiiM